MKRLPVIWNIWTEWTEWTESEQENTKRGSSMGTRRNKSMPDIWHEDVASTFKRKGKLTHEDFNYIADKHLIKANAVRLHYYKMYAKQLSAEDSPIRRYYTGDEPWKIAVEKDMREKGRPHKAAQYINRIAAAFGANANSVNAFYYKIVKEIKPTTVYMDTPPKPIEANPIQYDYAIGPRPDPNAAVPQPRMEPKPTPINAEPFYVPGSLIQVQVTDIGKHNAYVKTMDGRTSGYIHQFDVVPNQTVKNFSQWFKKDQILYAKVVEWRQHDRKLKLSTKDLGYTKLSWTVNPQSYEKVSLTQFPSEKPVQADFQEKLAAIKPLVTAPNDNGSGSIDTPTVINKQPEGINLEQEWAAAKPIIEAVVGKISEAAEQEMRAIMKEHTVFAFTATLFAKKENFTPDIGLMLAQAIRQDLKPKEGL